ncbi:sulfotransferase family protein [Psychroflexus montanilacus]|uniref:sulfotransferase family protein n=1 Tax=Psychroflexus montanilacus TaxID=2873598 RepID=UPI001CCD3C54|nr:sulfotransferase [Psychroflexus montanilacus]MBZ9652103.1 sulfotransferase [Psychroflexus montanilacus]
MRESTIIGIHGVPRSGTSWLGQLINASSKVNFKFQPLFSYAFKDYLNETSSRERILKFFEEISSSDDDFINLRDKDLLGEYPSFKKDQQPTHLVFKQVRYHFLIEHLIKKVPEIKFIFILRHPLEVLNSWRKAPREFKLEWDFNNQWLEADLKNLGRKEEYFGYLKWKEASELFLRLSEQYPTNVVLVQYDELNLNTTFEVKKIYDFIGLEIEDQVLDFITESRNKVKKHPNSVFKSSRNSKELYQKEISQEIQDYIEKDLKDSPLKNSFNNVI